MRSEIFIFLTALFCIINRLFFRIYAAKRMVFLWCNWWITFVTVPTIGKLRQLSVLIFCICESKDKNINSPLVWAINSYTWNSLFTICFFVAGCQFYMIFILRGKNVKTHGKKQLPYGPSCLRLNRRHSAPTPSSSPTMKSKTTLPWT